MKLSKKARIRGKQIARNKRLYDGMTPQQVDNALEKVRGQVAKKWQKKGIIFNR